MLKLGYNTVDKSYLKIIIETLHCSFKNDEEEKYQQNLCIMHPTQQWLICESGF